MKSSRHFSGYSILILLVAALVYITACEQKKDTVVERPIDPWAFRSVLDKRPRMLTLALDSSCYVAYDLSRCTLYKAWKGGVTLEGAAYTNKKNVQPTAWGTAYFSDSANLTNWIVLRHNDTTKAAIVNRGYSFHRNQISLFYDIHLPSGDTVQVEERPEFVRNIEGRPGLERQFTTKGFPDGFTIALINPDSTYHLPHNSSDQVTTFFDILPPQSPLVLEAEYDHRGRYWMEKSDCLTCHEIDRTTVGPSFRQIATHYSKEKSTVAFLIRKIREGGSGTWGTTAMNAHPTLANRELNNMIDYIFSLAPDENITPTVAPETSTTPDKTTKPGFGAPLEALHPSYTVSTLHFGDFKPRVGGLAFLPDGRLLVTTWEGCVYQLRGVESGDTTKMSVKKIASGLAEPLGIVVADGAIYVLQKQELTRLVDIDGDEVIDRYESVCNQWGVTADFHEFGFGLVYKDGYFYATLSMAMRLLSDEKQQPDRGKTLKISKDGRYSWINYGLRTPNGIGVGPDDELFVTDNQGEWLPGNKLIHVKQGAYHGMRWGLPDSLPITTTVVPPAIWIPENEIGNSPSEPVLMRDGPYVGQLLHGDVTHGGIKRDFLEIIDGEYQGAVFRFSQGLAAGVNRLVWGPDGALYVGEVGMVGGWSWKEKKYGLQRMMFNNKTTFEMLAIRAQPHGFEIEFTEPLSPDTHFSESDFFVQQWWYLATANYGGPKMDLETLHITNMTLSDDRTRVLLEIPSLKKEHVVYFRLSEGIRSAAGSSLWSGEAWYTLNKIPH